MNFFKKVGLLATCILFSVNALANDAKSDDDICLKAAGFAEKFMELRQNDNSITKTLSLAKKLSMNDPNIYLVLRYFVMKSYEVPVAENKKDGEKAIREFSNKITLECLQEVVDQEEADLYKEDRFPDSWNDMMNRQNNDIDETNKDRDNNENKDTDQYINFRYEKEDLNNLLDQHFVKLNI